MPLFNPFTVVFTDLEPDDVLALKLLKNKNKNFIIISGEREEETTSKKCSSILNNINFKDNNYVFTLNGAYKDKPTYWNLITSYLSLKLSEFSGGEVISIKPSREMFYLYKNIGYTPQQTTWMYGSFNNRKMMFEGVKPLEIEEFLNSFNNLVLYESFLVTGSKNSVTSKEISINDNFLKEYIKNWNAKIANECYQESLQLESEIEKYYNKLYSHEPQSLYQQKFNTNLNVGELISYLQYCYENKPVEDIATDFKTNFKNISEEDSTAIVKLLLSMGRNLKIINDIAADATQFLLADAGMIAFKDTYGVSSFVNDVDVVVDKDSFYTLSKEGTSIKMVQVKDNYKLNVYDHLVRYIDERV